MGGLSELRFWFNELMFLGNAYQISVVRPMLNAVLHSPMYHLLDVSLDRTCIILLCTFKSCLPNIISGGFCFGYGIDAL